MTANELEQARLDEYRANVKLLVDNCKDWSLLDLLYKILCKEGVQVDRPTT